MPFIPTFAGARVNKQLLASTPRVPPVFATLELDDTFVYQQATQSKDHVIDLPANRSAGDLVIIGLASRNQADNDGGTQTWPAGWTLLALTQTNGLRHEWRYRVLDGSEGSSITVTTTTAGEDTTLGVGLSLRFTGHGAPGVAPAGLGGDGAFSANPNTPELTPAAGSLAWLWFSAFAARRGSTSITPPENYTGGAAPLLAAVGSGSSGLMISAARRELAAASEDPGAWTLGNASNWNPVTFAIPPAPAA